MSKPKLPQVFITSVSELPMVQIDIDMPDEDFAELRKKAMKRIPRAERDRIIVSEFIRLTLIESRREPAYICGDCAIALGAKWPKGHAATQHQGICGQCMNDKGLCAIDDWDWPKGSKRPSGYGGGRD